MQTVRVLPFHATYGCRHSGACCTSNWPIPVEADRLERLRGALASGALRVPAQMTEPFLPGDAGHPDGRPAMLARIHERCVFFEEAPPAGATGRCRIHAAVGHDALPLACRQFPRVSVVDPRGVSVTLSHYCPTAAALLNVEATDAGSAPVINAAAFPPNAEYSGLDAREALPPLVRPGMLMDWESWWECERLAVAAFAAGDSVQSALARVRAAIDHLESWSPADGALIERVRLAFRRDATSDARVPAADLVAAVEAAIPVDLRPRMTTSPPRPTDLAARRFLAAHTFANWAIHLGSGLRVWLRSIEAAHALIDTGMGVRAADLRIRHLADTQALCAELSALG